MHRSFRTLLIAALVAAATASSVLLPTGTDAAAHAATAAAIRTATTTRLFGAGLYTSPTSEPAKQAAALASTDPAGAKAASTIARYPIATWLGEWSQGTQLQKTIDAATSGAATSGTTPVFVTYAIPGRDCGGYSAGGFDEASYDAWIDQIVARLQGKRAAVVVEPDALAMLSDSRCTPGLDQQRYRILSREVRAFTAAGVPAYLDAGNSNWVPAATMAQRLTAAGVADARGFATNVSNYYPVAQERAYADAVSAATGGSHYVIDTSRNGRGWKGTWCNPPGAGLGTSPRVDTSGGALDALLWVKTPGASDGTCNGGPSAGTWYSAYAQALVANAVIGSAPTTTPSTAHDPVAVLDAPSVVTAGVRVTGSAYDLDAPTSPLTVTITVDGAAVRTVTAARTRSGLPSAVGSAHGWDETVPAGAGTHGVCVLVRNQGGGSDVRPACRTVTVPASAPAGRFDSLTSPAHRRFVVRGWTFDRDAVARALAVRVTLDGRAAVTIAADGSRPDVDAVHHAGSGHGFAVLLSAASGARTVCVTAIGVGPGGDRSLGCRTVTVR